MERHSIRTLQEYLLASTVALSMAIACSTAAFAQTYSVIWNFPEYSDPTASPHPDPTTGTLYGTTLGPDGTVYSLKERRETWKNQTLLTFDGTDGATPYAGLIEDSAGNLYGTTSAGGTSNDGTVFELTPSGSSWNETMLHEFSGGSDGIGPESDLIMDKTTGAIYGTTNVGGAANCGTVFELTQADGFWTKSVIYTFGASPDGCLPQSRLREDSLGRLYGVTELGGRHGFGTAYLLAKSPKGLWRKFSLHNFSGGTDGGYPTDLDLNPKTGTLYGTTYSGGRDYGVVFQLTKSDNHWSETRLYAFAGGSNGESPRGLHLDLASNTLYGTTQYGGSNGAGTVFQFVGNGGSWTYSQLHIFGASGDGAYPYSRPTVDPNTGYLYGTTTEGGAFGGGTAWTIIP